jgi:hypothetical protein
MRGAALYIAPMSATTLPPGSRVVAAKYGGGDSSVTAALLMRQG